MAAKRSSDDPKRAAELTLYTLVEDCTNAVPEEIQEAVRQDLFLRVYTHDASRLDLIAGSSVVKDAMRLAWKDQPDRFGTRSLDAPIGNDSELTLADILADESDAA